MTEIEKVFYERLALQEEYGGTDKPINRIQPLVSVVTITYQHAPYIHQCLDSILMQETDFPYEIIIGEDGSTDGTREICIEYANKYPEKIRLFLRDRKLSHYTDSRGRSIRFNGHFSRAEARGKYIALCEGDDYWCNKYKLAFQAKILEDNTSISLCFHNAYIINEVDDQKNFYKKIKYNRFYSKEEIILQWLIPTASVMFRNEINSFLDKYLNSKLIYGDLPLWLFLAERGELYGFKNNYCVYRRHYGGMLINSKKYRINLYLEFYDTLSNLFPDCKEIFSYIKLKILFIKMIKHYNIESEIKFKIFKYSFLKIHKIIFVFLKDLILHFQ